MIKRNFFSLGLVLTFLVLSLSSNASAQTEKPNNISDESLDFVELEKMTVWGENAELALRVVKAAFDNKRSSASDDANKIVCWVDQGTGTHLTYLYCGTNWALDSNRRASQGLFKLLAGAMNQPNAGIPLPVSRLPGTRANIFVSANPVSEAQLENLFQRLGPSPLNREIVARTMQGDEIPDNVPTEAELDRFLKAYRGVKAVRAEYQPRLTKLAGDARKTLQAEADAAMAHAIDKAGLTVDRYNHISELSEEYTSLRNYLAKRLAGR